MASKRASRDALSQLAHPVYLDTPMLISFLAALDDGVYFSSEVAEHAAKSGKSDVGGGVNAKMPSLISLMGLSLSANGKYARQSATDQSIESKFVREHTSASLFNRLRSRLHSEELVHVVPHQGSLKDVKTGSLIEISGRFETDPIRTLVDFFKNAEPFSREQYERFLAIPEIKRAQRQKMSPEELAELEVIEEQKRVAEQGMAVLEQTMNLVKMLESDLDKSPVVDLVLKHSSVSGLVAANREFFGDEVAASLLGGQFTLLGKVTDVNLNESAELSIIRRGAMSSVLYSAVVPMVDNMREIISEQGIKLEVPDAIIKGPFVQVIPLAIFV